MFYIVADTEAAPIFKTEGVNAKIMRVYDLGYIVVDGSNNNEVVERRNFAIVDTFKRNDIMSNAYYADKLPMYYLRMQQGTLAHMALKDVRDTFAADCKKYDVSDVWAWNCRFDYQALNATVSDFSNGFVNYFAPYGVNFLDIAAVAGETVCNTKKYVNWCVATGNVTPKGNPKTTAESVYRYMFDADFTEEHTALADAEIEGAILAKLMGRKGYRKSQGKNWGMGWRTPAKLKKSMGI